MKKLHLLAASAAALAMLAPSVPAFADPAPQAQASQRRFGSWGIDLTARDRRSPPATASSIMSTAAGTRTR
jgi:hypothetical protein